MARKEFKETDEILRTIDGREYRIINVPHGERDSRVIAKISCAVGSWSYASELSPKRADICIGAYLMQKKSLSASQLRFCGSMATGLGLNAYSALGYAANADYEAAIDTEPSLVQARIAAIIAELLKHGDRMIINMVRRNVKKDKVREFAWLAPSTGGAFSAVFDALSGVKTATHELVFSHDDDDD